MAIHVFPVWLPLITMAAIGLYFVIHHQFRFNDDRTIDEVTAFFRKIDWSQVQELFDPAGEYYLRLVQSKYHFRRTIRVRIHEARELLWRMYHNVRVVHEWANTELRDLEDAPPPDRSHREAVIIAIAEKAAHFRAFATIRLVQLTAWTIFRVERWPFVRPSVASLCKCGPDENLLDLYEQLKQQAAVLALFYGQHFSDEMLAVL